MSTINDGGPAFPADSFAAQHCPGMSLRDWFAGQALGPLVNSFIAAKRDVDEDTAARGAYIMADAMLAARKGGK